MTRLILAEKPAVARDLARALGVSTAGGTAGCFRGTDLVITWCIGHLVELEEPAAYQAAWRRWSLASLPMLPERFLLRPIKRSARQFRVVRALLQGRGFGAVINACDAGREGELIFRYCYEASGCKLPIERLWISSLTPQAILAGMARLAPGRDFDPLAAAARCRAEADWLVGMNATRAVTLKRSGPAGEGRVLLSIGRVQTPTLALLVKRERAIERFVPRDYFEVRADLSAEGGAFCATWQAGQARRLAALGAAEEICGRSGAAARGGDGPIVETLEEQRVREPPPLLFDLTALQRTANRRFGLSAQRSLDLAQSLYERHKLITYPRTDSRHLTQDLITTLPQLFSALAEDPSYAPHAAPLLAQPPVPPRRVFMGDGQHDHHAIIPTPVPLSQARTAALSREERLLLDLIARRFLGAFYPDAEFQRTRLVVRVGPAPPGARLAVPPTDEALFLDAAPPPPDRYVAQGRVRARAGWQAVAGIPEERQGSSEVDPDNEVQALPLLSEGQRLSGRFRVAAQKTRPPPRHSEATLLSAMESAGRSLDKEELRRELRDLALGTPATRAAIIETLLARGYIERQGRVLLPTALGVDLIERLPVPSLASAALTAEWEARLLRIARGTENRGAFMADIARYVQEIIAAVVQAPALPPPPASRAVARPEKAPRGRRPSRSPGGARSPARSHTRSPPMSSVTRAASAAKAPTKTPPKARKKRADPPAPPVIAPIGAPIEPFLGCPRCHAGRLLAGRRGWGCSRFRQGCPLVIPFELLGCRLREADLRQIIEGGVSPALEFRPAAGPPLRGRLRLAAAGSPAGFVYLDPL